MNGKKIIAFIEFNGFDTSDFLKKFVVLLYLFKFVVFQVIL